MIKNNSITIPISIGELIDKLSILHVKKNKITDIDKLNNVNFEFDLLKTISEKYLLNAEIKKSYEKLISVNQELWDVEDKLRVFEKDKKFDEFFIHNARLVYILNDKRYSIKNNINLLTGSEIKEVKDYVSY
jgi:hypothetical protein